ncbi:MAG: DUF5667 domain-containing protein [Anaerolineales bacterium]|nr:DUF5667 domain-containing protein [Anaerolineales bacterium]
MKEATQDALQDCLEEVFTKGKTLDEVLSRYPHLREELSPLLESALWVRSQRATFSLSPQRQAVLRERVLTAVQVQPLPRIQSKPRLLPIQRRGWLNRMAWSWSAMVFVLICLLIFFTSGIALAAQNSLPGEPLYAVKAAVEEASVLMTWDAAQRARLRMAYAERRLEEVARLAQQGRAEAAPLALSNYEVQLHLALQETRRAARTQPLQAKHLTADIEARLQNQSEALVALDSLLPPAQAQIVQQAQNASRRALQNAASIMVELEITFPPTPTSPALATLTPAGGQFPLSTLFTPTELILPPGLLRQTQSPTPRASLTPHAMNTHRPTQRPTLTPRPTNTHRPTQVEQPTKTPKPPQVKPPTKTPKPTQIQPLPPTPKPTNPNKPSEQPQPPGQNKPTKTPKK